MNYLSKIPYVAPSFDAMQARSALIPGTERAGYERWVKHLALWQDINFSRIEYDSGGCKVTGVEVLSTAPGHEKMPLVIYNRGGNREYGMLSVMQVQIMMAHYAYHMKAGVLASNYRGNDGGEGREEFGGVDIGDVLALIEIGKAQPWWDGKNIFMLGWSRGGMMTYLALKHAAPITAAAIGAGTADLFENAAARPEMEKQYEELIPDYANCREQALRERSAVFWPEKINAPLLLLHGDADWRVDVSHARRMYALLKELGKPVNYIEFSGGDHGLIAERAKVQEAILDWFKRYRIA